ncbi:hypothetical protein KGY73_05690 [bacterium]|nr:hypothetical protein [bacterium]
MQNSFRWNPYADQPHNVLPRKKRFIHHLKYTPGYFRILTSNLKKAGPVLAAYRRYRKGRYEQPVSFNGSFGVAVSPAQGKDKEITERLKELGIHHTLVRIPSWEKDRISFYENFIKFLHEQGIEVMVALLQHRRDVEEPSHWEGFVEEVFSRLSDGCSYFEIGHAWNRTKWGLWDFREYLRLVRPVLSLASSYGVHLVGPAVIDFEFHLYPPVLKEISFDVVSSLLYVDRMGPPEKAQFGWDLSRKLALLKAVVDVWTSSSQRLWITEMNWPLAGTEKYSPASGTPNVSEEEQADYLVRYYVLSLSSGFVERVYWWQLAAPGYGLVDNRESSWRKRPSYWALKTMVKSLEGSYFVADLSQPPARIFLFRKKEDLLGVCWSEGKPLEFCFSYPLEKVISQEGEELSTPFERVRVEASPKYVYFKKGHRKKLPQVRELG